jgi:hypothetical protein
MRKMRDDSTWNRLTPEQREMLEEWLFEERLGYADTLAKVEKEFGLQASLASMGRYYRRRARERQVTGLAAAQVMAFELNDLPVSTDSLRTAAVKLVGKAVLKLAGEKPEQVERLASLTKLLLESESNDIRRSRLKLAEKYFHYEATAAYQKELPQLRAYLLAVGGDTSLSHDEKMERIHEILFGLGIPKPGAVKPDKSKNGS